jgi:DNA-binding XRE family transcriptional regulator
MAATPHSDAPTGKGDYVGLRLRLDYYDEMAAAKGAKTVEAQAALHGLHRSTMFRLRNGERVARLATAMRMAADLDTTVEKLFQLLVSLPRAEVTE